MSQPCSKTKVYAALTLVFLAFTASLLFLADNLRIFEARTGHFGQSVQMAASKTICDTDYTSSREHPLQTRFEKADTKRNIPVLELALEDTNKTEFCATQTPDITNALLHTGILTKLFKTFPGLTFRDLAWITILWTMIPAYILSMLLARRSDDLVLPSAVLISAGIVITSILYTGLIFNHRNYLTGALCLYLIPFILPLRDKLWWMICIALGLGVMTGLYAHFRGSDFLASWAAVTMLFIVAVHLKGWDKSGWIQLVITLAIFNGALITVDHLGSKHIENQFEGQVRKNEYKHTEIHPLVIALGEPETVIAKKYGIKWQDMNGVVHASKINPDITQVHQDGYEDALWIFYKNLWKDDPALMIVSYGQKLISIGNGMGGDIRLPFLDIKLLYKPLLLLMNPLTVIGLSLIFALILWQRILMVSGYAMYLDEIEMLVASTITAAMGVKLLEALIMYSPFSVRYHNAMIFVMLLLFMMMFKIRQSVTGKT